MVEKFSARGLSAGPENATEFSLLILSLNANEFATFFSTASYGQAFPMTNEVGMGYVGISIFSIFSSEFSKTVLTTSPQVHQRLKHFSVAHFTFVQIVTLAGLGRMPAVNLYRNHPRSSSKYAHPFESAPKTPQKVDKS